MSVLEQRVLLVISRGSGKGHGGFGAAIEVLTQRGHRVTAVEVNDPETIPRLIGDYPEYGTIALAGGDGTLNAALPALLQRPKRLGILPAGTANDFARSLQIPMDIEEAARVIADGRVHAIDVGRANDVPFLNVASLGISVRVAHRLEDAPKRRLGLLAYAHALLIEMRSLRPFSAHILSEEGEQQVRTIQLSVGNGRYYGMRLRVAPGASLDEGMLHLYSIPPLAPYRLLALSRLLPSGRHTSHEEVLLLQGKKFEVHTRTQMAVNTDGEVKTHTPVRFDVLPAALKVYVPATYHSPAD